MGYNAFLAGRRPLTARESVAVLVSVGTLHCVESWGDIVRSQTKWKFYPLDL